MEYRDGLGRGWRVGAKALERMIDECSGDAHRWLDVLNDLMDARAALDATRAKLAECEQKAESYDLTHTGDWFERAHALGQRDPAKYAGRDIWHVAVEMAESLAEVERERDEARADAVSGTPAFREEYEAVSVALAASQAREARLREAGSALAHWATPLGSIDAMIQAEQLRLARVQWAALASAPGSTDALREVCERAWRAGSLHGMGGCNPTDGPPWTEADDKRMAAEVANILGERGKEGGDDR